VAENQCKQQGRENRVMNVRRRVPGEKQREQSLVTPAPLVPVLEQKEQRQRKKPSPLKLKMRHLREPPGNKSVDKPRHARRHRVMSHVARQRPGADGREKHSEQEQDVVSRQGRGPRRVERKTENRGA